MNEKTFWKLLIASQKIIMSLTHCFDISIHHESDTLCGLSGLKIIKITFLVSFMPRFVIDDVIFIS